MGKQAVQAQIFGTPNFTLSSQGRVVLDSWIQKRKLPLFLSKSLNEHLHKRTFSLFISLELMLELSESTLYIIIFYFSLSSLFYDPIVLLILVPSYTLFHHEFLTYVGLHNKHYQILSHLLPKFHLTFVPTFWAFHSEGLLCVHSHN